MVERRSPKPEVVVRVPPLLPKFRRVMKNPLKFIQEVKQKLLELLGQQKRYHDGSHHGFCISVNSGNLFLILDQILRFLLNLILTINF